MPVAPPTYRQTRSLRAPGARRRGGKPYEFLQKKEELDDDDAEYIPGGSGKQTGLCSQLATKYEEDELKKSERIDADDPKLPLKDASSVRKAKSPETCKYCSKTFASHLQRHLSYHCSEVNEKKGHICPYCEDDGRDAGQYSRMDALLRHVRAKHPELLENFASYRRQKSKELRDRARKEDPALPVPELPTSIFSDPPEWDWNAYFMNMNEPVGVPNLNLF